MDLSGTFTISLIVYAIAGSVFFVSCGVLAVILFIRVTKIVNSLEKVSASAARMSEELERRIQVIDVVSSIKKIIKGYFRED